MPSPFIRFAPLHKRIASICILALLLLLAVFSMAIQAKPDQPDNEQVDDHSGPSWRGNPRVVLDGTGTVQAFWDDHRQWPQKSIYGNVRAESWGAETRLFSGNAVALGPCAVDTVGTLYFTYRDSNGVPRFQKRPANGDWDTPETIPNDRLPSDLAVTGNGNIYLIFTPDVSGRIYALARTADGTWLGQERVNPDGNALLGVSPRLTWGTDGTLYAVWGHRHDETGEAQIYLNHRATAGEWGTSRRVYTAPTGHTIIGADISASASDVHILWTSCDTSNTCQLFYNQCNSQDCPENKQLHTTTDNNTLNHPRLVIDERGNVYGLLSSYLVSSGLQKLYLTRRSTEGIWSDLVALDSFEGSASQYDLGQGGGFVAAVWSGWLGGDQGHAIWSHTWQAGFLPGRAADLAVQDIQTGQLYEQGEHFHLPLTLTIKNDGEGDTYGVQVRLAHGLPNQVAPTVTDVTGLAIAAGVSRVINYDWDVTDIMGRLDLIVTADPNNQIYELVETNNQATVSLVADAAPHLTHIKSNFKPGAFLQGVPLSNTFFVRVDWNGDLPGSGTPDYVTFALNDEHTDVTVNTPDAWATQDYDMGTQLQPGANFLRLSATNDAGRTSRVTVVELRGREAPTWLTGNATVSAEPPTGPFAQVAVYQVEAAWPPTALDATFTVPEAILPVMPGRFGTQLSPWSLALELRSDGQLSHIEGQGELTGYLADQPLIADERAQLDIEGNVILNAGGSALALDALTATLYASQTLQTARMTLISSSLPIFAQNALMLTVDGNLGATEQSDGTLDWITRNLALLADVNGVLATSGERLTYLEGGQGGQPHHMLQLSPGDTYTNSYTATLFAWAKERAFIWDKTWEVTRTSATASTAQTGTLHTSGPLLNAYLPLQATRSLTSNALPTDTYPYADPALASLTDDDMTMVHVRQSGIVGLNLSAYRWDGTEWRTAGLVTQGSYLNVQPALAYAGQNPLLLWTRFVKPVSDPDIDPHQILGDTEIASVMYLPGGAHPPTAAFRSTSPDVIGEQTDFYNDTVPGQPTETAYTWDFGDDSPPSTLEDPSHLYQDVGTFAVVLTATNAVDSDVATATVTITCTPPSNLNLIHSAPVVSETITFTGTCQSAPSPTYTWSFGDGPASRSGNPITHTYYLTGNYTVQMTATNFCGYDTISRPLTVTFEQQRDRWPPQTATPFRSPQPTASTFRPVPMSVNMTTTVPRAHSDWLTMTLVTNNTVADMLPTARADVAGSGHVLAMWLRDPDNDYPLFLDETTRTLTVDIIAAHWDGFSWTTPTLVLGDVNTREAPQFAYRDDEVVMAWSHDQDANPQTVTDTAIYVAAWLSPTTWTPPVHWDAPQSNAIYYNDGPTQASVTPRVVFDADGQATVVWVRTTIGGQDQLWYATYRYPTWSGPQAANWTTNNIQGLKVLVTPDNNLIALWQARSARGMDLWYSIFDRAYSLWSTPMQLTDDDRVEADYDAVVNSTGQALVVYTGRSVINISRTVASENVIYPTLSDRADIQQTTSTAATTRDLTVTDLQVSPPNPSPGSVAIVSGTLVNDGSLTINPAYVVFRDNGDDISIFYDAGPLAAGERAHFAFDWDVPDTGIPHTLSMLADPEDVIAETDEANNVETLTTVLPDLHPTWRASDFSTATITVTVGVRNIGVIATDASFTVMLRAGSRTGTPYASVSVPPLLAAGAETSVTLALDNISAIPANATLSYALVDASGAVIEADEQNNVAAIDVPRRPDLTFGPYDLVSAPSQRLLVRNQGPVAASDAVVTVYRDVLDGAELLSATLTSLAPGEWIAVPLSGPPGPFALAVRADPGNTLTEGDESNNILEGSVTLWPRLYLPTVYKGP